jgi:hypothetical protein
VKEDENIRKKPYLKDGHEIRNFLKKNKRRKRSNLAIREDVMNKNFFRAFKREYKNQFGKQELFSLRLKEFSSRILKSFGTEFLANPSFRVEDFNTYLGIFLNYWMMKKSMKTDSDREKLENINFIAYSYSHEKFYEFMKVTEVKALLVILFRMVSVEEFINSHEALRAHREYYINHVKKLWCIICNRDDASPFAENYDSEIEE